MSAPWVASLTELLAEHGDATYREVLRVPALSLGLFAAAPGHDDMQSPHEVDEVYVVVAGRAVLEVGTCARRSRPAQSRTSLRTSRTASSMSPRTCGWSWSSHLPNQADLGRRWGAHAAHAARPRSAHHREGPA